MTAGRGCQNFNFNTQFVLAFWAKIESWGSGAADRLLGVTGTRNRCENVGLQMTEVGGVKISISTYNLCPPNPHPPFNHKLIFLACPKMWVKKVLIPGVWGGGIQHFLG